MVELGLTHIGMIHLQEVKDLLCIHHLDKVMVQQVQLE